MGNVIYIQVENKPTNPGRPKVLGHRRFLGNARQLQVNMAVFSLLQIKGD